MNCFRNADLSDPNQQGAISIIDKAKTALPLLILATKNGLNKLRERIGNFARGNRTSYPNL